MRTPKMEKIVQTAKQAVKATVESQRAHRWGPDENSRSMMDVSG